MKLNTTDFDNSSAIAKSTLDYFGHAKPISSLDLSTGAVQRRYGTGERCPRRPRPPHHRADGQFERLRVAQTGPHPELAAEPARPDHHCEHGDRRAGGQAVSALGNIFDSVKAYAGGGVESHMPQISRAVAPFRIWAEPETGGEAYIPLADDSRRTRAESILTNVANRFGMQVLPRDVARMTAAASMGSAGSGLLGLGRVPEIGSVFR